MKTLKEYLTEGIFDVEDNIKKSNQYILIENILNDIKSNPKLKEYYTITDKNKKDILNVCRQLGFKKAKTWKDIIDKNYIAVYHPKSPEDIKNILVYKSHNGCGYISFNNDRIFYPIHMKLPVENAVYKTPAIFKKSYEIFIVPDDIVNMLINIYE